MIEVIAEIGVNHNGDLETALKLVDAAQEAGATAVKTQLWNTERVYPREKWEEMKPLELPRDALVALKWACEKKRIELIVTPDEIEDARFIRGSLGCRSIKTGSADITNLRFIRQVVELAFDRMIMSTGACNGDEMWAAIHTVLAGYIRPRSFVVMHCVSAYPAPIADLNLSVISKLEGAREWSVGFSDHTLGSDAAQLAYALGARVFEKHITLDKKQQGPDHAMSLEPKDFRTYCHNLRLTEQAIGDGYKRVMPSEQKNRERYNAFIAPRK